MLFIFKGTFMNLLIKQYDKFITYPDVDIGAGTKEQVFELVDHIFDEYNPYFLREYCSSRISTDDAATVAFTNPSVCNDYFESTPMRPELIMNHMSAKQLAYHLTFTEPAKATEVLDELLYYRNHRRI